MGTRGEIFSTKADTDKRTYFFNVKENRFGDHFLNIAESRRVGEETDKFERRQISFSRKTSPRSSRASRRPWGS